MLTPVGGGVESTKSPLAGMLPQTFGSYELLERIAGGGMGIVYKARQNTLNRLVALKVIVAGEVSAPDFLDRFRTEAEAAARLDHPNIVPIYEIGEVRGQPFFSMKLIEGQTLAHASPGADTPEAQRQTAAQLAKLARAVHYAHQRGIIHRDLKPNNVLLDSQGEPHLTDFGLAKLVEKESTITKTMAVLGTPSFMAPEQARGESKRLTTAADVYGLGAIFYQLLTGQPPFAGGTTMETIRLVLEKEPRHPSALNSRLDRDLETICLKCLEKEPVARYGSAEALADDLDRWLRHEPILARPVSALGRFGKWAHRHPTVATLLGGLIISMALGFALTLWQSAAREQALQEGRRSLYAARIGLAEQAWAAGHISRARALLESLAPKPGQPDLRGFEWSYLWRISRDQSFFTLSDDGNPVQAMAASPDGRWLALAGDNPFVSLWDIGSRQFTGRLPGARINRALAVSPDAGLVAGAGQDNVIRIWDAGSQRELFTLPGHMNSIQQLVFSPDGKILASASRADGVVKLWNLTGRSEISSQGGMPIEYPALAFAPDSGGLAWSAGDRTIHLVDLTNGTTRAILSGHGGAVACLAFSPNGKWLASGSKDLEARLWEIRNPTNVIVLSGHRATVTSLAFSPDGRMLATACADGTIKLWNVSNRKEITTLKGHEMWVYLVTFLPDGHTLISASQDGKVKFWTVVRDKPSDALEYHSATWNATALGDSTPEGAAGEKILRQDVCEVRFSTDGSRLATLDDRAIIQVWDRQARNSLGTRILPNLPTVAAVLMPDGRRAISVGADYKLRLWELESHSEPVVVGDIAEPVRRLAVSPDGSFLASGTSDGRIVIRETKSWKTVATIICGSNQITALRFHPDNQTVLGVIKSSRETSWLVRTSVSGGTVSLSPESFDGTVTALAFSPDNEQLAGSSRSGVVLLWQTSTLKSLGILRGHSGFVTSAAYSPDGRTLASASNDGTVKLWAVDSRQELLTLPGNLAPWTQLAFSPDGAELVGCGEAGLLRVWRASADSQ